jgi:hypothetical protein
MRVGLHHLYSMVRGVSVEDILHCRLSSILPLVETGLMVEPSENYLIGHLAHFPDFSYQEGFGATERLRNRSNSSCPPRAAGGRCAAYVCGSNLVLSNSCHISLIGAIYGLWRNLDESNVGALVAPSGDRFRRRAKSEPSAGRSSPTRTLTLDELQAIDLAFNLSATPFVCERCLETAS